MTVSSDTLADHLAGDLAMQFGRRHEANGLMELAGLNYREAVELFNRCGCKVYEGVAIEAAYTCYAWLRANPVGTARYAIR